MSEFDDADLGSSPDYLWRDANGRRFGLWAQLRVVEEWTRILRYCEYDGAAGEVHMVTPFVGPDGDLVDYYALKSAAGGWHLMYDCYDCSGHESAAVAALAQEMGCRLEMGILRADIPDKATEGEAAAILLSFLSAAVALAVAGSLLPADDATPAAPAGGGEWLTADFEDGTVIDLIFPGVSAATERQSLYTYLLNEGDDYEPRINGIVQSEEPIIWPAVKAQILAELERRGETPYGTGEDALTHSEAFDNRNKMTLGFLASLPGVTVLEYEDVTFELGARWRKNGRSCWEWES